MNVDSYIASDFAYSSFCAWQATKLNRSVKNGMLRLTEQGTFGAVTAKVVSPFVGAGTLLVSTCLRIGSLVEPIIGICADVYMAMFFASARPIVGIFSRRLPHIFRNLLNVFFIVRDTFKFGLVVGVGGIVAPRAAYNRL